MSQFDYINNYYGLNVKRGSVVRFSCRGEKKMGSVLSSNGAHIFIRTEDGDRVGPCHPTWEIEYL